MESLQVKYFHDDYKFKEAINTINYIENETVYIYK